MSVFEADDNFRPLDPKKPLYVEKVPFDNHRQLSALKIIREVDNGKAPWIPSKYLSQKDDSKVGQDLEEKAALTAFGIATMSLKKKDYETAIMNITANLLSEYVRKDLKYESRFLRKQTEAYVGLNNYSEAKKAIIRAMEIFPGDLDVKDHFTLGFMEYKLGNLTEALASLNKFVRAAEAFVSTSSDRDQDEIKAFVQISKELISKIG